MGLTKIEMWVAIVTLVLIFGITISAVGIDIKNNGNTNLDSKSTEYIDNFDTILDSNDIDSDYGNATLQEKEKNPLVSFATSLPVIEDVLGGINFFIDKSKIVISYLALLYNLPTFFLQGLGLPVGAFANIINVIGTMMLVVITIMVVRLVK